MSCNSHYNPIIITYKQKPIKYFNQTTQSTINMSLLCVRHFRNSHLSQLSRYFILEVEGVSWFIVRWMPQKRLTGRYSSMLLRKIHILFRASKEELRRISGITSRSYLKIFVSGTPQKLLTYSYLSYLAVLATMNLALNAYFGQKNIWLQKQSAFRNPTRLIVLQLVVNQSIKS